MNLYDPIKKQLVEEFKDATPLEQLAMCRRKINNYRQRPALNDIISLCEQKNSPVKINKVVINICALVHFAAIPEDELENFLSTGADDLYVEAFKKFGCDDHIINKLMWEQNAVNPTTIELNNYVNLIVARNIERVNNLPSSQDLKAQLVKKNVKKPDELLYSGAYVRERAILYFALKTPEERFQIVAGINKTLGSLLVRIPDKKYKEYVEMEKNDTLPSGNVFNWF